MKEERKELFTTIAEAGSRAYFFDVKENSVGTKYLVINERRDGKSQGNRLMVFPEYLEEFLEHLEEAIDFIRRSD